MAKKPRVPESKKWRIDSVYERRRDGPGRVEQAYRILVDPEGGAKEMEHDKTRRNHR